MDTGVDRARSIEAIRAEAMETKSPVKFHEVGEEFGTRGGYR